MHPTTINLKGKKFNQYPSKLIWIQLAGFDEEQITRLNFKDGEVKKGIFEGFTCIGMHWEYNSHLLNPPSEQIFKTLVTGKSNINGSCQDSAQVPFWSFYPESENVKTIVIEKSPPSNGSILNINSCLEANPFWKPNYLIRLDTLGFDKKTATAFSVLEKGKLKNKGFYYDSSCKESECSNNLLTTFSYIADEIIQYEKRYTLIIRDYSAENFLKDKSFNKWADWLNQWNQLIAYIQNSLYSEDTLILVTGVAPIPLNIPGEGQAIKNWLQKNSGTTLRPRSSLGKTWAMGARAENFCGLYKTDEILSRIFWQNQNKTILGL